MTQEPRPMPEPCERCKGSGWCWWDELDNYAGHDPTKLVSDDTRYSCPDCEGRGCFNADQPTPEQIENVLTLLRGGGERFRNYDDYHEHLDELRLDCLLEDAVKVIEYFQYLQAKSMSPEQAGIARKLVNVPSAVWSDTARSLAHQLLRELLES